jgi:hypothetical protein
MKGTQHLSKAARLGLLMFAGYTRVPVHERTLGVVPPGPDVQFELCGRSVPLGLLTYWNTWPLEHGRTVVMREPGRGIYDELDADLAQTLV